jgi:hypothetical protein
MASTYEPIATNTLGSAASSITFSSISSAYTDLRVVLTGTTASQAFPFLRFNTDTGNNYSGTYLDGSGSAASSLRDTNISGIYIAGANGDFRNTQVATAQIDIFSYAGSTNKTALSAFSGDRNGAGFVVRTVGLWRSTSAITSVVLSGNGVNWSIGTTATLYGILKA